MPYTQEDYQRDLQQTQPQKTNNEDPGFFESALAGIYTGLWNIPKGLVSLPLEIYDAFGNTNLAKQFENTWDHLNPFGDEAEKTLTGRLTQAAAQLGLPIGEGALIGSKIGGIVAKSLAAAREGKDLGSLASFGEKFIGPKLGAFIGSGVGAGLVTDQNIGTFADMLRGTSLEPYALTMLNIDDKEGREDAYRKLLNRVKFGTENALFGAAISGVIKGGKLLANGIPIEGTSGEVTTKTKILDALSVNSGMGKDGTVVMQSSNSAKRAGEEANMYMAEQSKATMDNVISKVATVDKKLAEQVPEILNNVSKSDLLNMDKLNQRIKFIYDDSNVKKWEQLTPDIQNTLYLKDLDDWNKLTLKQKQVISRPKFGPPEPKKILTLAPQEELDLIELKAAQDKYNLLPDNIKKQTDAPTLKTIEDIKKDKLIKATDEFYAKPENERKNLNPPTFESLGLNNNKFIINKDPIGIQDSDYTFEPIKKSGYNKEQIKELSNNLDKLKKDKEIFFNGINNQAQNIFNKPGIVTAEQLATKSPNKIIEEFKQNLLQNEENSKKITSFDNQINDLENKVKEANLPKNQEQISTPEEIEAKQKFNDLLNLKNPETNKNIFTSEEQQKIKDSITGPLSAINNNQIKLLQQGLYGENLFNAVFDNLKNYRTTSYRAFKRLPFERQYKITDEIRQKGFDSYIKTESPELKKAGLNEQQIIVKANEDIDNWIKGFNESQKLEIEQNKPTRIFGGEKTINVGLDSSMLEAKTTKPWQRELLQEIKNPVWTLFSTVNGLTNMNLSIEYFKNMRDALTPIERVYNPLTLEVNYLYKIKKENIEASINRLTNSLIDQKNAENALRDPNIKISAYERDQIEKTAKNIVTNAIENPEKYSNVNEPWKKLLERKTATAQEFWNTNTGFEPNEIKELEREGIINPNDKSNPNKLVIAGKVPGFKNLPNELEGMYIKARAYDPIYKIGNNTLNSSWAGWLYKNTILLPKAFSQAAKTVFSVATHGRNFLTASAYVMANGGLLQGDSFNMILPESLGGQGLLNKARIYSFKQALGTLTPEENAFYQRLLKVGVVNTSLEKGQINNLFSDTIRDFDPNSSFNRLINNSSKIQNISRNIQNLYTAEDSFWKVVNWNLERNRFDKILEQNNINKNNYLDVFTKDLSNIIPKTPEEAEQIKNQINLQNFFWHDELNKAYAIGSYDNFLDEFAGHLTRNQIPNYSYTTAGARALRLTPFGNFIAFPLEIMRTGTRIAQQGIKEYTSGIPGISGLNGIGTRRLLSFGTTIGGLPILAVNAAKSYYNVSDDEMTALRRFVPEWSKDSILMPAGRDDNGYLKYINLSYATPYDTIARPFNTLFVNIQNGIEDKETLYKSLGDSILQAGKEILNPFTSESIYTQGLVDSVFGNGIGKDGKRIWNTEDDPFVKFEKSIFHVGNTLVPSTVDTFKRFDLAVTGKPDDYGRTFNLKDELPGLGGFRVLQVDPEDGMKFKVNSFGSKIEQDKSLFSSPLLTGGRVTPDEIVDSYKYSEARRFNNMREMYLDIRAARKLGIPDAIIQKTFQQRQGITKDVAAYVMQGKYLPNVPNKEFAQKLQIITNNLNNKQGVYLQNPLIDALPQINEIINNNKSKDLLTDPLELPQPSLRTGVSDFMSGITSSNANVPDTGTVSNSFVINPRQEDMYRELQKSNALDQFIR